MAATAEKLILVSTEFEDEGTEEIPLEDMLEEPEEQPLHFWDYTVSWLTRRGVLPS